MKPLYSVPSMREIERIEPSGLTHVSTFSGCGGTCLGFRMAGFRTLWANDSDKKAGPSYRANHPGTFLDQRSITEVQAADILKETGLVAGELDVFEGSPPCTAFSHAGRGAKKWGGVKEHAGAKNVKVEELAFEFVRLLGGLMPRAFVVENVPAWAEGAAKPYFHETRRRMKKLGYRVKARVLDAQWHGVPQERRRLIIIGMRENLGVEPRFPEPNDWRHSLRDALPHAARLEGFEYRQNVFRSADRAAPTIMASPRPFMIGIQDGESRPFTIEEVKALCSFPADFELQGSKSERHRRLGNSVPPLLARAIALAVREALS
jgi:DNA (cytosine-5)-methyltransferase 1